ncbi:hypothetical protein KBZ21_42075, partial [Streptomyces sp. A73]|nr:hypothetical protein [Streptomyces sp. A73]
RAVVDDYADASVELAADFYDAERVAARVTGRFTVPLVGPPPEGGKTDPWHDPEKARREIEKLRKEAAKYRTTAKELEPLA